MLTNLLIPMFIAGVMQTPSQPTTVSLQQAKPGQSCLLLLSARSNSVKFRSGNNELPSENPDPYGGSIGDAHSPNGGSIDANKSEGFSAPELPFDSNAGTPLND